MAHLGTVLEAKSHIGIMGIFMRLPPPQRFHEGLGFRA